MMYTNDGLTSGEIKRSFKKRIKNYSGRNFARERVKDKLTKEVRSRLMSKILSRNTKFERDFILLLRKSTRKKFITNVSYIKGKPDILFKKYKICVFLDSDFWHGWQYPRWKHLLKNDFWRQKIESNRKRDLNNSLYLRRKGWKVLRFWEHKIKNQPDEILRKVKQFL